ncbi:MAG: HlyD family efflux transporter periplasmic adaptor subunit [Deltaproteobacteria bacterium]|nr:HlyD family efflux transporter periplasmic adaptor subunit [Deltaproteobacteria bacterium]
MVDISMDIPRTRTKWRPRRVLLIGGAIVALAAITIGVRWFANRAPAVARSELWIGTVKRGPLTLEVRGTGTLIPLDFRWASAPVSARVERVLVQPGAQVTAGSVLVELSNPDAQLAALEAERDVAAAEAELAHLSAALDSTQLAQESQVASLAADVAMASRRSTIDTEMSRQGVISDLESAESADRAAQLALRKQFERKRLAVLRRGHRAQLAAQRDQVKRLRSLAVFRGQQLEALHVRAGQAGTVQEVAVEAGQSVAAGAPLAKVIVPDKLQARLQIPEASTEDVKPGLVAQIDTRNGIVKGEVVRIDLAAKNGTVTVDIRLVDVLPKSARVDQNVEGVIELARTDDVLFVARPAIGEARMTAGVFRISGDEARRVPVRFGRAALKDIEIASGLRAGDQIILSDTSRWDGIDHLRIE